MRWFLSLRQATGLRRRLAGLLLGRTLPFHHLPGWKHHFYWAPPQCPDPAPCVQVPNLDHRQQRSHSTPHALCHHRHLRCVTKARRRWVVTSRARRAVCGRGVVELTDVAFGAGNHGFSQSSALRIQSGKPLPDGAFLPRHLGDEGAGGR
jgi:hypothetical protein